MPRSIYGAPGGTRTPTPLRVPDFESGASTGSATGAVARIPPRQRGPTANPDGDVAAARKGRKSAAAGDEAAVAPAGRRDIVIASIPPGLGEPVNRPLAPGPACACLFRFF